MNAYFRLAAPSALALLVGMGAAHAQGTLVGTTALDDRIDDIQVDAQQDLQDAQDAARFGPANFRAGWSGEVALTYSGSSGNADTQDLAAAGRVRYGAGQWTQELGFGVEWGEDDGDETEKEAFFVYDANYYLNDQFYIFGLARWQYDGYAAFKNDGFLGAGPGIRVLNTPTTTWRLQAGPGVRYVETQDDEDDTEAAAIASSRFFHAFNDTVYLTNDTDLLNSDAGFSAYNDLGLNVAMTDTLSTRISYQTEYNEEAVPGTEKTDNKLGVSLVMGF